MTISAEKWSEEGTTKSEDALLTVTLIECRPYSHVLCSAEYHRHRCTLQVFTFFEQFEALYMRNHNDKYLRQFALIKTRHLQVMS